MKTSLHRIFEWILGDDESGDPRYFVRVSRDDKHAFDKETAIAVLRGFSGIGEGNGRGGKYNIDAGNIDATWMSEEAAKKLIHFVASSYMPVSVAK